MKNGRKTLLGLGEHREDIGLENRKNIKYRKFSYCSSWLTFIKLAQAAQYFVSRRIVMIDATGGKGFLKILIRVIIRNYFDLNFEESENLIWPKDEI